MTTKSWSEQLKEAGAEVGDEVYFRYPSEMRQKRDFDDVTRDDLEGKRDAGRYGYKLFRVERREIVERFVCIWDEERQRKEGGE